MYCPECGAKMAGPARDYEDILLNHGKKVYYDVWSCSQCMELVIKDVEPVKHWSVS